MPGLLFNLEKRGGDPNRQVVGGPIFGKLPSFFPKSKGPSMEFRLHGGSDTPWLSGVPSYVFNSDNTEQRLASLFGAPKYNKTWIHGVDNPKRLDNPNYKWPNKKGLSPEEYWMSSKATANRYGDTQYFPHLPKARKPPEEIFSYGCNGGVCPEKYNWDDWNPDVPRIPLSQIPKGYATPEMFEQVYGPQLNKVTMIPPGFSGQPLAGLTNLPTKLLNLFNIKSRGSPFSGLHTYNKQDGKWTDTGKYTPVLDRLAYKYRIPLAIAGLAAAGYGAKKIYDWWRSSKDEDKDKQACGAPGFEKEDAPGFEKEAAPGFEKLSGFLSEVKHHLPRIRLKDSLIGAGVGAGVGALTHSLRRDFGAKDEDISLPGHMLTGGLLGAGVGNLAGDRLRRYVANNAYPAGYGLTNQMTRLEPRSLSQVWRTLVQDRPARDLQAVHKPTQARHPELTPFVMKARQELLRRAMGLPVREGENVFRSLGRQPFDPTPRIKHPNFPTMNLDPGSGGIKGNYETVEFDPKAYEQATSKEDIGLGGLQFNLPRRYQWAKDRAEGGPPKALNPSDRWTDPANAFMARHATRADVPNQTATISDLWDFAPNPSESKQLKKYMGQLFTNRKGLSDPVKEFVPKGDMWNREWDMFYAPGKEITAPNPHTGTPGQYRVPTGWEHLRNLSQRKLVNDWLLHRGGVAFKQKFDMSKPVPTPLWEKQQHDMSYELGQRAGTLLE